MRELFPIPVGIKLFTVKFLCNNCGSPVFQMGHELICVVGTQREQVDIFLVAGDDPQFL